MGKKALKKMIRTKRKMRKVKGAKGLTAKQRNFSRFTSCNFKKTKVI
jgi:hypothetical protein